MASALLELAAIGVGAIEVKKIGRLRIYIEFSPPADSPERAEKVVSAVE